MFSRSKAAKWRGGVQDLTAQPVLPLLADPSAGCGPHASVLHHRRQVDLGGVVIPVDDAGVEAERGLVLGLELLPAGEQPIDAVDRLALGVGAVELDVGERPLDLLPLALQGGRPGRLLAPEGQGLQRPLALVDGALGPLELPLHATAARERPVGHEDGLTLGVVDRVVGEEGADHVDEVAVPQGVDRAGGDLRDPRLIGDGPRGGVDDGGHDEVDRDHVDRALGHAGELLQQPSGVGDDHRLGHPEPADPSGEGLVERRLDDRRAHDRHGHIAPVLQERPLPEGLRVGVGVGPPEGRRPSATRLDHLLLHPGAAALLGLAGQRGHAGGPDLMAGLLPEAGERIRSAAVGLGVGASPAGAVDLAPPVDVDEERAVVHRDLGGCTAAVAGDVAGGHRHQVGRDLERLQRLHDPRRAEEVHLDGRVERRVERHGRGGVDDDGARGQGLAAGVVEGEPIRSDVARDRGDPLGNHRGEAVLAELLAQAVEGVVAEDLPLGALLDGGAAAGPDEQHELAAGDAPEQPLDQRGAEEPRAPRDRDARAVQPVRDHPPLSTIW